MANIWWERVPNAVEFITRLTGCLLEQKSVLLRYDAAIPWPDELFGLVRREVLQQEAAKQFNTLIPSDDPGALLLREYCRTEKRATYRPSKSHAAFLAEDDDIVLHDRYICVRINDEKQLEHWLDFISEYVRNRRKGAARATFLLIWNGTKQCFKKGVTELLLERFISEYDRIVYATLACSALNESPIVKDYLTELIAVLAGNDIELGDKCITYYKQFLEDPLGTIRRIVEEEYRSNGAPFEITATEEELMRGIWRAQIRTIYPMLEEFRGGFVHKYALEIQNAIQADMLPGEDIVCPEDVELGMLSFLQGNDMLHPSNRDSVALALFRNARNSLSHINILTIEEVYKLCSYM